jgi:ubiquinone/menaquinone biosynthesis C-methylase UbiE
VYAYYSPALDRSGIFDEPALAATTERHHLQLTPPPLAVGGADDAVVTGTVYELDRGIPSDAQLARFERDLSRGRRVWVYWAGEQALECVDAERLDSFRRHQRALARFGGLAMRLNRAYTIWDRGPTGLRWIYRGEFPVRRSDVLIKLTTLTMKAQPVPLRTVQGPALYLRTDYWNDGTQDDGMARVVCALASASGPVICLTARHFASLDRPGIRQVVMAPPRRTAGEDAIVLAPVDYLELVRTACHTAQPAYIYDRLTAAQSAGAEVSQALHLPYIVEYRGADAPVREALDGATPFYPELYRQSEELALRQAAVVVVRTAALRDELVARGIDRSRIAITDADGLAAELTARAAAERGRLEATASITTGDAYKDQAQNQWNQNPVGSQHARESQPHTLEWFREVERHRYSEYAPWMPEAMEFASHANQDVLEIGGGIGTDLAQFAINGARVTDIDLAIGHLRLAEENFRLRGLPGRFIHHDAESLPFDDRSFDVVYSNGVLHHTPNTAAVVREILRVLRPGGRAIVMLYAERSLHYWRKLVWQLGVKEGALDRISMGEIMSRTVERSANDARPLVKVYSKARAAALFKDFARVEILQRQLEPGELPASLRWALPYIERRWGWNLIIKADKAR